VPAGYPRKTGPQNSNVNTFVSKVKMAFASLAFAPAVA